MAAPSDELRGLRKLSKSLFGQKLLVAVSAHISAGEADFTLTGLAEALGVTTSSLQAPLETLVESGLITRQPARPPDPTRRLRRERSHFWTFIDELVERPDLANDPDVLRIRIETADTLF